MERYVLNTDAETMKEIFGVTTISEAILESTFNAAPGHSLPIIFTTQGIPVLRSAIWGISQGKTTISTLDIDEVLGTKKYTDLLRSSACIVPVSGFYKWKKTVDDPLPFFTRIHTQDVLGVAGIYIENEDSRSSFIVITKSANVLIKPLDNSMPCIIDPNKIRSWLTGGAYTQLKMGFKDISLLPDMTVFRVPELVNNLSNNAPELIQPIPKLKEED